MDPGPEAGHRRAFRTSGCRCANLRHPRFAPSRNETQLSYSGTFVPVEDRLQKDQMAHQFMYPKVDPVRGPAPRTGSGGPADAADTHNDTVSGPASRAHPEPGSGPPVGRDGPLRSAQQPVSARSTAVVDAGSAGTQLRTFRLI